MARHWWQLGPRVSVGYVVAAIAVTAAGWAAYTQLTAAREAGDSARHTQIVLHQVDELEIGMLDVETGQRGYLLTGEESYLEPYERGRTGIRDRLADLRRLMAGDAHAQTQLDTIEDLALAKLRETAQTIEVRREEGRDAALAIVETHVGKGLMDRFRALLATIEDDERAALQRGIEQRGRLFWWASRIGILGSGMALVVVVLSTLAVNRSVRSRSAAERATRESEERLRVTLHSIGDAVIATDAKGRVAFMNPAAETLTGWSAADARGQALEQVFRIVNEQTRETVPSPVATVSQHGAVVGLANHTVLLSRSGVETPIDDSGAPIRDAGGAITGVVLVFRDVSDRRRRELERRHLQEEEEARAEAERASRTKDEFLAILSHELRSPLQGILGWLTVLREMRSEPAQRQRALQAIERGVRQQAQLVNDILDVSRIVAGKLRLERDVVEIAGVVEECVDQALPEAREKALQLDSEIGDCGAVLGDRNRLRQSVTNVLSNAIKFTPSGGRITVRAYRDVSEAVMVVRDTGEGIAADFLPQIFDRFSQGDAKVRRAAGGLGLGLSIVRQIIESHGGSVRAESEGVGQGATFTLRVPLAPVAEVRPGRADAAPRPSASSLNGLSILVVDDDVETRESLATLLALRGAVVHDAGCVSDAVDHCARHATDVVISDIAMPNQDGFALVEALHDSGRRPILVALTGFASDQDRRLTSEAGFDAHVSKPVDVDALLATILALVVSRPEPRTGTGA